MQTKIFSKKISFSLFFLFLILSACKNSNEEDSKKRAEETNQTKFDEKEEKQNDAQHLVDLYSAGMFEIKVAEEAKNRATIADTKSAANMIDTSHQRINNSMKLLATNKQITLPTELTDKQKDKLQDLIRKKGMDFDKSFIDMMIAGHKDAIASYEETATKCNDIDIKNWAANTLPAIRNHLAMLTNQKGKMKN